MTVILTAVQPADATAPTRRARGRPALGKDRIVTAALELVSAEGADALSMRTLAQQLGSGTATLHRHFAGRDDLIAHVVDNVIGEIDIDTEELDALPWQRAFAAVAQAMFDTLRRHPNVATLMIERVPVGPHLLALRERALTRLLNAGFEPPLALRAWATLARYVVGFGTQIGAQDADPPASWTAVDLTGLPATMATAEHFPIPLQEEFAFGIELLIGGLERHQNR